jgi:hypothetical protein
MNYKETTEWLFSHLPMYQRVGKAAYKANLDRTLKLDKLTGHPHRKFRSIHVAGTNGKGSVCHMIASVLQQAGYQTGPAGPREAVPEVSRKKQDTARQDVPVAAGTSRDIWRDPVGDVSEFGVGRWLDIETVSVKAETGFLAIDIQIHFPLAASFNAASTTSQSLYRLAVLYFDTDGNRQTGGTAGEDSGRSGYDFGLDVTLEAPRNAPEKGRIHVGLFRFDNDQRKFLGPLPENQVQVRGNQIRITVPYTVLGMQAGDQLRMSFVESFQKQGSGLAKDKLITL